MRAGAIASIATAWIVAGSGAARAAVCPADDALWLRVALDGDGFTPALRDKVLELMGADLRPKGLSVCEGARDASSTAPTAAIVPTAPPLAEIALTLSAASGLSIELRDAVTDKRMSRSLGLAGVPADARALSVALAAEELLRASWIEAALAAPPSPAPAPVAHPVPNVVQALNAEAVARMAEGVRATTPASSALAEVALMGAAARTTGGQTDLGGDIRFTFGGRLAIGARIGLRAAPDVSSTHGTVQGRELLGGFGVSYAFFPRRAESGAELGARVDVVDVQFSGVSAGPTVHATSGSQTAIIPSGAIGGWLHLGGPWRVVTEASVGAPIRAVTASDAGETATGVSGVAFGFALGVAAALPED
jgi:hypothetical protein